MISCEHLEQIKSCWESYFRPHSELKCSEWAEQNAYLSDLVTARPGKVSFDDTPYLREMLDTVNNPHIREVVFAKGAQVGGSLWLLLTLGYSVCERPGPTLLVYPTIDLAKSVSKIRLIPFFETCPPIRKMFTGQKSDVTNTEIRFSSMVLTLAGSNSPASLSSRPIQLAIADEVDKLADATEQEASAVNLMSVRTRSYQGSSKVYLVSTPTVPNKFVWPKFIQGDQRKFFVPCPECQQEQVLEDPQLKYTVVKDLAGAIDFPATAKTAHFECVNPKCKHKIFDKEKNDAVKKGRWKATNPNGKPGVASFHIAAWYAPWVSIGSCALERLEVELDPNNLDKKRHYYNSTLGLPIEDLGAVVEASDVYKHRIDVPAKTIPFPIVGIILSADVQQDGFYYVIRAWGENENSCLLDYGFVETEDQLLEKSEQTFRFGEIDYPIHEKVIDSSDQTDRIYRFCDTYGWIPTKGHPKGLGNRPIAPSDNVPGLVIVGTDNFKISLSKHIAREISTSPDSQVRQWYVHSEIDSTYAEQVTGEVPIIVVDSYGVVRNKFKVRRANHLMDCEVLQLAFAYYLGYKDKQAISTSRTVKRESDLSILGKGIKNFWGN